MPGVITNYKIINLQMLSQSDLTSQSSSVQSLFNRIAPVYDQLNDWFSLGMHHIWKQMTLKWSNPHIGDTCLDLCCGSGDIAQLLAREVGAKGQVYGVDFSPTMLEVAQQRYVETSARKFLYQHCPITWIEADALNLPFADNYFDCATMGYGLRNVPDIPLCLQELYRVLKPGANAAILDMHRPSTSYMRLLQQWYLNTLVVPTAQQFGLTEEYAYISPSLDKFPTGTEQVQLARQAGFKNATHYPISGGMMGILVITK